MNVRSVKVRPGKEAITCRSFGNDSHRLEKFEVLSSEERHSSVGQEGDQV